MANDPTAADESPVPPEETPIAMAEPIEQPEPASEAPSEAATADGSELVSEAPTADGSPAESSDPLTQLADRALRGRLPAPEEEKATQLLITALLEGRDGVARAVEQLPKLPWIVGVNGVTTAWPEMKPTMRNRLLAGLARVESEGARRVRLSLARGLFKLEPPVAAKLAVGVAKEMRDKETGAVTARNAQIFANVLIGRAKPWIAQLPLTDLKPAEADLLVQCALLAVFTVPHAPVTQLGVIKWAADAGKLAKLPKTSSEALLKGLSRWSAKWHGVLRREVEGLPEEILAELKPEPPADAEPAQAPGRRDRRGRNRAADEPARTGDESRAETPEPADEEDEDDEDEDDREETDADADEQAAAPAKVRPVYESKTVPPREREREPRERERDRGDRRPASNFNLNDALRQIESHVASLRAELTTTQNKLRQRDDDRKPRKPERGSAPVIPGEPSADELARLNVQLEARNAELQQRIEELTADSEDRAASTGLLTGTPVQDGDVQLRNLLNLKLKEDHEDFLALEQEGQDVVAPKHYRTVLTHVFEVLAAEGILKE